MVLNLKRCVKIQIYNMKSTLWEKKIRVKEIRFALWRILINKATLYTKKEYNITIVF